MRYGAKSPAKRIVLISVSCLVAVALVVTGIAVFMNARTANATIDVESVSAVSTMYWGDQSSTYGTATSDFVQELYPDTTKSISEIFVEEGQTVKIGDTLLQYDTTKLELTVESKKLEVEKKNYELQQANKDLVRLQNTPPYVEPPIPEPEPEPTPTPVPPSEATLYSEITEHSKPFMGTGTTEDPYVFLCTEDCVLSKEFLMRLMGLSTLTPSPSPSASPTPQPSEMPTEEPQPTESPTATASPSPTASPAPTPSPPPAETPTPVPEPTAAPTVPPESGGESTPDVSGMAWFQRLTTDGGTADGSEPTDEEPPTEEEPFELPNGPFAARFEVHEQDNENLPLLKGWAMDGHRITAGFFFDTEEETPADSIEMLGVEPDDPWIAPIDPDAMYTQEQLDQMITEKKQEIRDLEVAVKQAKIDLSKAELELKNATVTATVNGTVKTLTDLDTALASSAPFLVVSGGDGFYVTGTLNESLLGRINVGDTVSVSAWEIGASFDAEIVKISDFPSANGYYDGTSNPNTSSYAFTAFIPNAEGLKNGMMLDIILQAGAGDEVPSDTLYLMKAYIRSDEGGRYILKVGEDKRVHKTYIETGKTVYNDYLEIKGDVLTMDDYVAFPYGTQAIDGAKANLPEDAMLGEEEVAAE